MPTTAAPIDPFGRAITYLRLSVTDRCNLRCRYCLDEATRFLPRAELLSLEELETAARACVALGIRKIRVTGGEPLLRRGVLGLLGRLGALPGLDELALTTNGTELPRYAEALRAAGVQRVNISLDSLDPARFRRITGNGRLERVLEGVEAARGAGFERLKLNAVADAQRRGELLALVDYAAARDLDISFIEPMPLGPAGREAGGAPSAEAVRRAIAAAYPLAPTAEGTGGPSRYYRIRGSGTRIGLIAPRSEGFCAACNRLRLTAAGALLPCLGHAEAVNLRAVLRGAPGDTEALHAAIRTAVARKPPRHDFSAPAAATAPIHPMSLVGG